MHQQRHVSHHRPTLLIVGCGDVGMRVLKRVQARWRVVALTSSPSRMTALREAGALPVQGNLDEPHTLQRLRGVAALADAVLHLAPPAARGATDLRTRALLQVLMKSHRVRRLVYASTTGVYGDCQGRHIDETQPVAPLTERALRRVDAEHRVRHFGRCTGAVVSILRVPGIYANDRVGGRPSERLLRGAPVLMDAEDVYTNHIHADDLARACVAALRHGGAQRVVNACDHTDLKMGDYFDLAAQLAGMPPPARITRAQAQAVLAPMQLSFMSESRRISNRRLTQELGLRLLYPTVLQGLQQASAGV